MSSVLSKKAFLSGFLVWLIPFLAAFPIFPLKTEHPLVFKTLMSVILVITTVWISQRYWTHVRKEAAYLGLVLGVLWMAISIAMDVPIFVFGFKMAPVTYFTEIALGYLALPIITWGHARSAQACHA